MGVWLYGTAGHPAFVHGVKCEKYLHLMKSLSHAFGFLHLNKCHQIDELYSKNVLKKEASIISRSYIGKIFHSKIYL